MIVFLSAILSIAATVFILVAGLIAVQAEKYAVIDFLTMGFCLFMLANGLNLIAKSNKAEKEKEDGPHNS